MATVGWAAVVTDFQTSTASQTAFPVNNSDLVNEGSPFLSSWEGIGYIPCPIESYGPLSALINGNAGGDTGFSGGLPNPEGVLDIDDGAWTFVVNLNTAIAPYGYDITKVETFTGHFDNRKSQAYTLLVSRVGETGFESIGSFEGRFFNWDPGSTRLTVSDSTGPIASGVDAIRWDVYTAVRVDPRNPLYEPPDYRKTEYESVYREFDVYGSPSVAPVPEPASLAVWSLLSMVGAGYGWWRKRRPT
jgi:hypothetical protein